MNIIIIIILTATPGSMPIIELEAATWCSYELNSQYPYKNRYLHFFFTNK